MVRAHQTRRTKQNPAETLPVIFLIFCFIFSGLSSGQILTRTQWTDSNPILLSSFPVVSSAVATNFSINFYVWIIPIMGNSVISTQQIARISRSNILTPSNKTTNQILLIYADNTNFVIESCGLTSTCVSQTIPISNYDEWISISITMSLSTHLSVTINTAYKTFNSATSLTDKTLFLNLGREQYLDVLQLSGFYYWSSSGIFSSGLPNAPSNGIVYNQNKILGRLSSFLDLSKTRTSSRKTDDDLLMKIYQLKAEITLSATFLLKKQIIRVSAQSGIFDERALGYCFLCISVLSSSLYISTTAYTYSTGIVETITKIPDSTSVLTLDQKYSLIFEYDHSSSTMNIFLDDKFVKTLNNVIQPGLSSVDITFGGNFVADSFFGGHLDSLDFNYGLLAPLSISGPSYATCNLPLCSECLSSDPSNCLDCLVSQFDQFKDSSTCACQINYYFSPKQVCAPCHKSCSTCSGVLQTECLTCPSTRIFDSATSQCICAPSYYDDSVSHLCQPCDSSCLTCLGPFQTECISCFVGREINSLGQCVCKDGYYFQPPQSCIQCLVGCQTCSSSSKCDTCLSELVFQSDSSCACDDGYYQITSASQGISCKACTNNCSSCSDSSDRGCLVCKNGYRLTQEGWCEIKLYVDVLVGNKSQAIDNSSWVSDYGQITVIVITGIMLFADFFMNIYANKFGFTRIFRAQQFILKILYLKLVATDFTHDNYELLSALTYFNGLTHLFNFINPFQFIPTSPGLQIGSKIYLERIPSSLLQSTGGVLVVLLLLFVPAAVSALIVRKSCQATATARNVNGQEDNCQVRDESLSISSQYGIEVPLNQGNQHENDAQQNIHNLQYFDKLANNCNHMQDKQQTTNKDKTIQESSEGQQEVGLATNDNSTRIQRISRFLQHAFWHFHEYAINVICFACILHLVGASQEPSNVEPQNFLCYVMMLYIFLVCMLGRSLLIRKPKHILNLLVYRDIAIENEKILERRDRNNHFSDEQEYQVLNPASGNNSPKADPLRSRSGSTMPINSQNLGTERGRNSDILINAEAEEYSSGNSINGEDHPIKLRNSNENDLNSNNNKNQDYDSSGSAKEKLKEMMEDKWIPRLQNCIWLRGFFECLNMEFITGFKGCKFFFCFYILNYLLLATAIASVSTSSVMQYGMLCMFQVFGIITSLFRPYLDILESIKNIIDNVAFFVVIVLQFLMTAYFSPILKGYVISKDLNAELNIFAYISVGILLLCIISFPAITGVQIYRRRKEISAKAAGIQGNQRKVETQREGRKEQQRRADERQEKQNQQNTTMDILDNIHSRIKNQINSNQQYQQALCNSIRTHKNSSSYLSNNNNSSEGQNKFSSYKSAFNNPLNGNPSPIQDSNDFRQRSAGTAYGMNKLEGIAEENQQDEELSRLESIKKNNSQISKNAQVSSKQESKPCWEIEMVPASNMLSSKFSQKEQLDRSNLATIDLKLQKDGLFSQNLSPPTNNNSRVNQQEMKIVNEHLPQGEIALNESSILNSKANSNKDNRAQELLLSQFSSPNGESIQVQKDQQQQQLPADAIPQQNILSSPEKHLVFIPPLHLNNIPKISLAAPTSKIEGNQETARYSVFKESNILDEQLAEKQDLKLATQRKFSQTLSSTLGKPSGEEGKL